MGYWGVEGCFARRRGQPVGSLRADAIFKFHYTIAFLEVQVSAENPIWRNTAVLEIINSSMPKIDVIKIPTKMLFDRTESP